MGHKDILVDNRFNFRFIFDENKNEWVCSMPTWLIEQAQNVFSNTESEYLHNVKLAAQAGEQG